MGLQAVADMRKLRYSRNGWMATENDQYDDEYRLRVLAISAGGFESNDSRFTRLV